MNLKKLPDSEKSFIHIKNSSGPKMEPCGSPVTICNVLDAVSFYSTNCSLTAWMLLSDSVIVIVEKLLPFKIDLRLQTKKDSWKVTTFPQIAPCLLDSSLISYMLHLGYGIL